MLGLLKPVQQAPAAAVAAAAAVPSCIPPAVHNVLPQVLAQQQQQPFPIYQTARARFEAAPTAEAQTHLPQIECARDAAAAGIEALRAQVLGSSDSDGTMSGSGGGGSSSSSSSGPPPSQLTWQEELAAEMANKGGFEPIMGLFPIQQSSSSSRASSGGFSGPNTSKGFNIPWQDVDLQLQQVLRQHYQ